MRRNFNFSWRGDVFGRWWSCVIDVVCGVVTRARSLPSRRPFPIDRDSWSPGTPLVEIGYVCDHPGDVTPRLATSSPRRIDPADHSVLLARKPFPLDRYSWSPGTPRVERGYVCDHPDDVTRLEKSSLERIDRRAAKGSTNADSRRSPNGLGAVTVIARPRYAERWAKRVP